MRTILVEIHRVLDCELIGINSKQVYQCSKLTFLVSSPSTSSEEYLLVLMAILPVQSAIHHLATYMIENHSNARHCWVAEPSVHPVASKASLFLQQISLYRFTG